MNRRRFLAGTGAVLLATPLAAEGQQARGYPRVGFLLAGSRSDPGVQHSFDVLRQALRELGYVEGQSIAFESRWAEGKYERLPDLATELVSLKVDVIVAVSTRAALAAKQATSTVPIVMTNVSDPVANGLVASLARPGGNITGLAIISPELVGKELEMLREVVPKVSRVAVLWNPANPGAVLQLRSAEVAARALGVRLQVLEAQGPGEIDRAFAAMRRERAGALLVVLDSVFLLERERIADLAAKNRLPAVYGLRYHAEAGGLMAYGANVLDLVRGGASYVDKILKGAKPADLPIEQPIKFELVINLKTAKALGLTIPPSLLGRADEVIQ
jgi:putative tryptophan/tyrosine transport system substrate-binding protein